MKTKNDYRILGIMSGTSLDGVDLALCSFSKNKKWEYEILKTKTILYSKDWKEKLNYLHQKSNEEIAEINSDYFPFFTVKNVLLDRVDHSKLVLDFPKIRKGGSFPSDSVSFGKSIQSLLSNLESNQMRKILEDKFTVDLEGKPTVTTFRGYSRKKDGKIHSDSKTKIITVLIYLNEQWSNTKGLLRMLKEEDNLDSFIEEIPATMGSMVAFKVTDNCWHGFIPYEGKRCLIQLNYLYEESLTQHRLRHRLSSFLKQIC